MADGRLSLTLSEVGQVNWSKTSERSWRFCFCCIFERGDIFVYDTRGSGSFLLYLYFNRWYICMMLSLPKFGCIVAVCALISSSSFNGRCMRPASSLDKAEDSKLFVAFHIGVDPVSLPMRILLPLVEESHPAFLPLRNSLLLTNRQQFTQLDEPSNLVVETDRHYKTNF